MMITLGLQDREAAQLSIAVDCGCALLATSRQLSLGIGWPVGRLPYLKWVGGKLSHAPAQRELS